MLLFAISFLAGCIDRGEIGEQLEVLDVEPVVDQYFLGGYYDAKEEALFVVAGDLEVTREEVRALIIGERGQAFEFGTEEVLSFAVFRGVFSTGGHGLEIERIERISNSFSIHAVYSDPGRGMMATQAFTHPTAIIPIGKLSRGDYEVNLIVTRIVRSESGDKIVEEDGEHANISFAVK